jgi:glucosyl-3-phosphoglycerate synthase
MSQRVSVCLPARNEAATVGTIVERVADLPVVDQVVVVDDGSTDATAAVACEAGATVVATAQRGKGEALWTAVGAAKGDVLVFCDADLLDFDPSFVTRLVDPLLASQAIQFVKGTYGRAGEGGRVTELVARPLLSVLFPHLERFAQPLAGEFAARREVLESVPFVQDYGVDLALLVDVVALVGLDATVEVDLGVKRHRNRPLQELRPQAEQVLRAALHRAGVGPPVPERPPHAASR